MTTFIVRQFDYEADRLIPVEAASFLVTTSGALVFFGDNLRHIRAFAAGGWVEVEIDESNEKPAQEQEKRP